MDKQVQKMSQSERKEIENTITNFVSAATTSEYAKLILSPSVMLAIIDDVMCTSAWDKERYYSDDDVRIAIGRVFADKIK